MRESLYYGRESISTILMTMGTIPQSATTAVINFSSGRYDGESRFVSFSRNSTEAASARCRSSKPYALNVLVDHDGNASEKPFVDSPASSHQLIDFYRQAPCQRLPGLGTEKAPGVLAEGHLAGLQPLAHASGKEDAPQR